MICANCSTELRGAYCHECGQSAEDPLRSLRGFVSEALGDVVHIHSRTFATLRDLFNPGFLTREYIAGRRARHIGPFQLYFLAAAIFFLAGSVHPVVEIDPQTGIIQTGLGILRIAGNVEPSEAAALAKRGISMPLFAERFENQVNTNLPSFLILSLFLFALILKLFYPFHQLKMPVHGVFALHWSAFYLLSMSVDRLVTHSNRPTNWSNALGLVMFIYMLIALHRVYRQSWPVTFVKALGIFIVFNAILGLWVASVVKLAFKTI